MLGNREVEQALSGHADGELAIDLLHTEFIAPSGLVVVAVLLDRAAHEGWRTEFIPPCKLSVQRYLSRMDLQQCLDAAGCGVRLPEVKRQPANDRLVELKRFVAGHGVDEVADLIYAQLQTWNDGYLQQTLYDMLFELGLNIEEHAQKPGYVAAQYYRGRNQLDLAVGDFGIGIRRSLAHAGHEFDSAAEAIVAAATTRLTSKPADGGFGLNAAIRTFAQHRGSAVLVSDGVAVRFLQDGSARTSELRAPYPGTFLFGTLPWS